MVASIGPARSPIDCMAFCTEKRGRRRRTANLRPTSCGVDSKVEAGRVMGASALRTAKRSSPNIYSWQVAGGSRPI